MDVEPFTKRDSLGRYLVGNPPGPGNPYAKRVAVLRTAMLAAITGEDVRAVVLKLIDCAKDGDVAAARLLAYAVGKPVEVTDADEGESPIVRMLAWIRTGQLPEG